MEVFTKSATSHASTPSRSQSMIAFSISLKEVWLTLEILATDGEPGHGNITGSSMRRLLLGLSRGGDAKAPLRMFLQQFGKLGVPLFRSHQDDFRQVLPTQGAIAHVYLKELILAKSATMPKRAKNPTTQRLSIASLKKYIAAMIARVQPAQLLTRIQTVLRRPKVWARL